MTLGLVRALIRVPIFLLGTAVLVAIYGVAACFGTGVRRKVVRAWHRFVCALVGLRLNRFGTPLVQSKGLMVANHVSYLDIPVLGSFADVTFVAKAEVANWPFFGPLARLVNTEFVERRTVDAQRHNQRLRERLNQGETLLVFPEGTSSPGEHVKPFKSSLFEIVLQADDPEDAWVQPVTIAYVDEDEDLDFAWYGDMTLLPHLWQVFTARGCDVGVIYHAPILIDRLSDRKTLALRCEDQVADGLGLILEERLFAKRRTPLKALGEFPVPYTLL